MTSIQEWERRAQQSQRRSASRRLAENDKLLRPNDLWFAFVLVALAAILVALIAA